MNWASLVLQGLMFLDVLEWTDVRKANSLHPWGTQDYLSKHRTSPQGEEESAS